jgi:gas vesicle protein
MPKYKNKFAAQMKQHQIDHLTEDYAEFLKDMDAQHEERIRQMREEHKEHKARLIEQHEKQKEDLLADVVIEVKQNKSKEPKEIAPGIIVLPGDYYVEDGLTGPFGIPADELEVNYEKA